jgi:hypothetical protein
MSVTELLIQKVQALTEEQQKQLLEYIDTLPPARDKPGPDDSALPRINPMGLFAHLGVSISQEEIKQARREMWANFPRDYPDPKSAPHE